MESPARRRLLLISSHINPSTEASLLNCLSSSACKGDKETKRQNDCVFCKIIRGEAPALKVYEDDACLCILDTHPLSHGHSLIIPKCHFPSLDVTPPSIMGAMCSKVPLISNAVMKATGCGICSLAQTSALFLYSPPSHHCRDEVLNHADSFNLLVNNGEAAGQVIYHTHIHIIPRKAHDCLWASESLRRRQMKIDQEASQLANRIIENLSTVND